MLKKIQEAIRDKAITWAVGAMMVTGVTFLINSGKDVIEIPKTVRELSNARKRDSATYMTMWLVRMRYQDSINKNHNLWLQQDFDTLRSIKWKLKRNKIR